MLALCPKQYTDFHFDRQGRYRDQGAATAPMTLRVLIPGIGGVGAVVGGSWCFVSFSEPNYPLTSFCLALLFDELTVFRSSRHIALENSSIEGKANRENLYAFILGSLRPRPTVDSPNYAKVIGTPH